MIIFWNNQIFREFFFVEPRGVEPRSQDFQSCAYTKSAKVPFVGASGVEPLLSGPESDVIPLYYAPLFFFCTPRMIRTLIKRSVAARSIHWTMGAFVVEAGLKPAIFALRGQWLNQFVYSTILSLLSDSNQRPMGYDAIALPSWAKEAICRSTRTRTQKKRFGISHVTITSWTSVNRAV